MQKNPKFFRFIFFLCQNTVFLVSYFQVSLLIPKIWFSHSDIFDIVFLTFFHVVMSREKKVLLLIYYKRVHLFIFLFIINSCIRMQDTIYEPIFIIV